MWKMLEQAKRPPEHRLCSDSRLRRGERGDLNPRPPGPQTPGGCDGLPQLVTKPWTSSFFSLLVTADLQLVATIRYRQMEIKLESSNPLIAASGPPNTKLPAVVASVTTRKATNEIAQFFASRDRSLEPVVPRWH